MGGQEAIWHVLIDDKQHGPLTKDDVLEHLRAGMLAGSDLIWRPGFSDWKPVRDTEDFWRPPKRTSIQPPIAAPSPPPIPATPEQVHERGKTDASYDREKWSLWKAANIGLIVSACTLLLQIGNGRGYELANYAHTASAETITFLASQILAAPALFFLVALVRNLFNIRQPESSKSALWGVLSFTAMLIVITSALTLYQELFFNSTEAISGETRKWFVDRSFSGCVAKQRSLGQNVTEAQIDKYCTCAMGKLADTTTYRILGTELDASALVDLKQRAEAAGSACR
jgi:hypothetical protein